MLKWGAGSPRVSSVASAPWHLPLPPSVRTPRDDTMGGVSSIYPHSGLWTAPNPSLLFCTGKLFLLAQVCSPASLFLPYHLLPLDGCSFSSPQVYIPGHQKKGKKGHDLSFWKAHCPEIPLNSSTYVSLAITWSQDYQLAVGRVGKKNCACLKIGTLLDWLFAIPVIIPHPIALTHL